jgi:hypothetical protein
MDLISRIFKILFEDSSFFSKEKPFSYFFPNSQLPRIQLICNKVIVDNFDVFLQFRLRMAKKILRANGLNCPRLPNRIVLVIIKYLNNYFMSIYKKKERKTKQYKKKLEEKNLRKKNYWIEKLKNLKTYNFKDGTLTYANRCSDEQFTNKHLLDEYDLKVGDEYISDTSSEVSVEQFERRIPRTESFDTYESHDNYGIYFDPVQNTRFNVCTHTPSFLTQEAKDEIKNISYEVQNNYDLTMKMVFYFKILKKINNNNPIFEIRDITGKNLYIKNFNRLGQLVPAIQFLFYTPRRLNTFEEIKALTKTFVPLTDPEQLKNSFFKENKSLNEFWTLLEFESDPYDYFSDMLAEAICYSLR